jgi:hypothetical protein
VYAPPELLLSGIYSRAASTAWSLGILLFNMLGKVMIMMISRTRRWQ